METNRIKLDAITVEELHKQLGELIAQGHGKVAVVGSDCRARYPLQVYPVRNSTGYVDAVLVYVRPDAHFTPATPLLDPMDDLHEQWNARADEIKSRCGAFA